MDDEIFKIATKDNIIFVERNYNYINYKGELKHATIKRKSKNTEGDNYVRRIGIIIAVLKTLGFSRSYKNRTIH